MIRKFKYLLTICSLVILCLIPIYSYTFVDAASDAKTLAELRSELKAWQNKQKKVESDKKATQSEINYAKNSVSSKQNEIATNQQKIADATAESEALDKEIAEGKISLANMIQAYQIAKGENVYLEYVFEATSYEDLIYRYAIVEQIMNYQEDKITEWKEKIEYNNQLKNDLAKKEVELGKQITSLANEIDSLGNKLEDYFDISLSIEEEIKSNQELIKYYESIGCKENEDLDKCVQVKGDTGFRKPLKKGTITSYFGYRTHPVSGKPQTFHNGVDIGGNKEGTSIYSLANGMVGKVIKRSSCGGNMVYIYHNIKGKKYTSVYMHLLDIKVKVGDVVTSNTIIGTVGGGAQTKSYDKCTTGAHLHLGIATGWYGKDYYGSSDFKARGVNPKTLLNLPNKGVYWYSR